MTRRDWIIAVLLACSWAYLIWNNGRWHELNTRTAALAAKSEAYAEMCRAIKGPKP